MESRELAKLLLPEEIVDYFDIVKAKEDKKEERLDIYLDEKYIEPEVGCESKGFREAQVIRDFPIRGNAVYLHVRRRKWQLPDGSIFSKTYDLTHLGTRITKEFAAFLKEAHRV